LFFETNLFLDALTPEDREPLLGLLASVQLQAEQILFRPNQKILYVYFPTTAVISYFAPLSQRNVEVALAGRDGVVGAAAIEGHVAASGAMVRIAGTALRGNSSALMAHVAKKSNVLALLRAHQNVIAAQALQSAACIASHDLRSRLILWLSRAVDLHGPELSITQDQMAEALGVRRTSVSGVAKHLLSAEVINYARGRLYVKEPASLRSMACECYGAITGSHRSMLRAVRKE
jgi:hypothetical protein